MALNGGKSFVAGITRFWAMVTENRLGGRGWGRSISVLSPGLCSPSTLKLESLAKRASKGSEDKLVFKAHHPLDPL